MGCVLVVLPRWPGCAGAAMPCRAVPCRAVPSDSACAQKQLPGPCLCGVPGPCCWGQAPSCIRELIELETSRHNQTKQELSAGKKKKKKKLRWDAQSGSQGGHADRCFSTAGSAPARQGTGTGSRSQDGHLNAALLLLLSTWCRENTIKMIWRSG